MTMETEDGNEVNTQSSIEEKYVENSTINDSKRISMCENITDTSVENTNLETKQNSNKSIKNDKMRKFEHLFLRKCRVTCPLCHKKLSTGKALKLHMVCHMEEKSVSCPACNHSFHFENSLKLHMKQHHPSILDKCEICNKPVYDDRDLEHHKRQHEENVRKSDRKNKGGYLFITKKRQKELEKNMKIYGTTNVEADSENVQFENNSDEEDMDLDTQEGLISESAEDCTDLQPTQITTNGNEDNENLQSKTLSSKVSIEGFNTQQNEDPPAENSKPGGNQIIYTSSLSELERSKLEKRFLRTCPVTCPMCFKKCMNGRSLKNHINYKHEENSTPCPECGRVLPAKAAVKTHMKLHHSDKLDKCEVCDKPMYDKRDVEIHKRIHVGEIRKSDRKNKGGYLFSAKKKSKELILSTLVHKKKPKSGGGLADAAKICCSECDQTFEYSTSLRKHLIKVHNQVMLECKLCGDQFLTEHQLHTHEQEHDDFINPSWMMGHIVFFACDKCQEIFTNKDKHKKHVTTLECLREWILVRKNKCSQMPSFGHRHENLLANNEVKQEHPASSQFNAVHFLVGDQFTSENTYSQEQLELEHQKTTIKEEPLDNIEAVKVGEAHDKTIHHDLVVHERSLQNSMNNFVHVESITEINHHVNGQFREAMKKVDQQYLDADPLGFV